MIKNLNRILQNKNIKLILFGETHGFALDYLFQEEIIHNFKPDIFLYEMLEDKKLLTKKDRVNFLNQDQNKVFSKISTYKDLLLTVSLANKYNLPIIGNDYKNMLRKKKIDLSRKKFSKKELKIENTILFRRELRQRSFIQNYMLNLGKKVFVSTGIFHLRDKSILTIFKKPFVIIYPVYQGKKIFAPTKNMDRLKIKFVAKLIK